MSIRTVYWQNDAVVLIDQKALPLVERTVACTDYRQVIAAIDDLTVRGAPAIGVAAALGIALGMLRADASSREDLARAFETICEAFARSRPTARNLFWAVEAMRRRFAGAMDEGLAAPDVKEVLKDEAIRIGAEDEANCRRLGAFGAALIADGDAVLTHCNAGALATAGYGTALGVLRAAWEAGKTISVFVDETRPVLQGARLTAWEMVREGIPATLITDSMAASLMAKGRIDKIVVGADRIAANGDTANKIGTYGLAVLAQAHKIPFYVAAPLSTIDLSVPDGSAIPIEERNPAEVTTWAGVRVAPEGIGVYNPAFDVTPAALISAVITEAGVAKAPFGDALAALFPKR